MGAWDSGLYDNDDALDARGILLASVALPEEDVMLFAACVGLLALLEPDAHQFRDIGTHVALAKLPPPLRDATAVAARVDASGPRLPYADPVKRILGTDASYGRMVDPLLELREAITIARVLRDRCVRAFDDIPPGDIAAGGPIGLLVELRELGVATNPDVVEEWLAAFDRAADTRRRHTGEDSGFLRSWSRSFRDALELLATAPERKVLGGDPTTGRRRSMQVR